MLSRKLKQSLTLPDLTTTTIYTNPSVTALVKAISELSLQTEASTALHEKFRQDDISKTLQEFQSLVEEMERPKPKF